jgi:hypothetical protein
MANATTSYKAKKAATLSNPTSASTFVTSDNSSNAAVVYFPVVATGTQQAAFRFRARGRATTVGSHNVTPKVSYGVSATAGSNTIIAAASARAVATTTAGWAIEGTLFWDSTSKILTGVFWALNGSTATLDALAALTATVSSVDLTASGLGLSVECTIATGGGDSGFLDELALEVI